MIEQFIFSIIVFMACAGGVVAIHQSPLPLPNLKPFNCAFCSMMWLAVFFELRVHYSEPQISPLLCAACYPLYAGVLVGLAPWMFRSFEQVAPAPVVEEQIDFEPTDSTIPPTPAKIPARTMKTTPRHNGGQLLVEA